jgi:hypothetical protein
VARQALQALKSQQPTNDKSGGDPEVWFPLGMEYRTVQPYKMIRTSQFLFQTPNQRKKFDEAIKKFAKGCGCGLELLSLRRRHNDRQKGSIVAIARAINAFSRAGGENITKQFNLTRSFSELEFVQATFFQRIEQQKMHLKNNLYSDIDARRMDLNSLLTGWLVSMADLA